MDELYKRIWYKNKLLLEHDLEVICNELSEGSVESIDYDNKSNYVSVNKYGIKSSTKLKGKLIINMLMLIDNIDNTCTVANLFEVYQHAFEVLDIDEYSYNKLPLNDLLSATKDYKDKWDELKVLLNQILQNKDRFTVFKSEEVVEYVACQLEFLYEYEEAAFKEKQK